jgi:hypothetical protein
LAIGEYDIFFNFVNWELESQAEARKAGSLIVYCDPQTMGAVKPKGSENVWQDTTTGDEWTDKHHGGHLDTRICEEERALMFGFALRGRIATSGIEDNGDFDVVVACQPALDHGHATIQGMADELRLGHPLASFLFGTLSFLLMHEIFHVANPDSE